MKRISILFVCLVMICLTACSQNAKTSSAFEKEEIDKAVQEFDWKDFYATTYIRNNGTKTTFSIYMADLNNDSVREIIYINSANLRDIPVIEIFSYKDGKIVSLGGLFGEIIENSSNQYSIKENTIKANEKTYKGSFEQNNLLFIKGYNFKQLDSVLPLENNNDNIEICKHIKENIVVK